MKFIEEFPRHTPMADDAEMFLKFRKPRAGGNWGPEIKPHVDFLSERFFILQFFEKYCRNHRNIFDSAHQNAKVFSNAFYSWKIDTVKYLKEKSDQDSRDLASEIRGITYENLSSFADTTIVALQMRLKKIPERTRSERSETASRIRKWQTLSSLVSFANTYDRLK